MFRLPAALLLLSLAVLNGCAYTSRTLMDGEAAVPMPVLPMLPMGVDQRMMIQGGLATTWAGTTAERMDKSSDGPLVLVPRLLGTGGNFQWRHKAFFTGVEVAGAVHEEAMASAMVHAMLGVNVAGDEASFLAWTGLGLGLGSARFAAYDRSGAWFGSDSTNDSVYRGASTSDPLMASAGVSLSLLDKEPVSPFLAGRVALGLGLGNESGVRVTNPVDFSRTFVDAGVRWRPADRWRATAGVGVSWYRDGFFKGVDANAYVGMCFTLLKPPMRWKTGE